MRSFFIKHFILLIMGLLCLIFVFVYNFIHHNKSDAEPTTLERIRQTGKLRLITTHSLNTYYHYEGQPAGFEYDLAMEFARYLKVELDVVTPGWNHMFDYLDQGRGDFLAAGISITQERLDHAVFSIPYMTIQQRVIYHHKTPGPEKIDDLASKTFHIRRGSAYHSRLEKIRSSGVNLNYTLHDNIPTEELIAMVHNREIPYTLANSNIALINQRYYPDIRIGIAVQEKEPLAWAVGKNESDLLAQINQFVLYANENGILKNIMNKYYENTQEFDVYELKKFHQRIQTLLPEYKKFIMEESEKYGLDWRLVAAVVYQESHFNPHARSVTNVQGLMQLTHATAEEMGVENRLNPRQSIRGGIKYLNKMRKRFSHIQDDYQQMLFALASYNIGYGHVLDALKIAEKKGLDTHKWQALKTTLPLLSKSRYYEATRYGYARGWESVQFVERILTYFDILKQKTISPEFINSWVLENKKFDLPASIY